LIALIELLYFYVRKQLLLHRILAIAILSVCLSVHSSVTRVNQSKAVQASISKFSPSSARNYRYAIQIENLVFVY